MSSRTSRRRFLATAGGSAAVVFTSGSVGADQPGPAEKGKPFEGTSKKGNFQDALDAAIEAALKSAPGADRQARWILKEVTGIRGGITGATEVSVKIEATV